MEYNRYLIYANDYRNSKHPKLDFLFHNTDDCDEPQGAGKSILDCKEQINELIIDRKKIETANEFLRKELPHIYNGKNIEVNDVTYAMEQYLNYFLSKS